MIGEEHVTDFLAAYALDCLDEQETVLVSEHLAHCEACRRELISFQAVTDQLPLALPQVEPPGRVKAQLMARIEAASQPAQDSPVAQPWWRKLTSAFQNVPPAWSMASLVLVLLLVASNLLLWQRVTDLRSSQPPAGQMRLINLSPTADAPGATGLIVMSVNGEHGTLVVDHLPALPKSSQYQLWLIRDGKRTSGGVFSVSSEGYGSLWVKSNQPLGSYTSFGITIEPAGGSPGPTGKRVLGANL